MVSGSLKIAIRLIQLGSKLNDELNSLVVSFGHARSHFSGSKLL